MKFKRIMSILGGIMLLGATVGSAALLSYSPTSLKTVSNPAIVYGQAAATTDFIGASDILTALNTDTSVIINENETTVNGEVKAVETSSQPLYFGDWMNDTKTTFTKEQLPTVLADGQLSDSDGKDFDYNLRVNVPNSKIVYGEGPDNLEPPVIYADFNSNTQYEMRIIFPTAVDVSKLDGEQINLFGKKYTFSSNNADLTNTSVLLFENTQSLKILEGASITSGGHTFSANVEDTTRAIVYVDGESKTVKEGFSGKIHGADIYVKEIFGPDYSGSQRYVEIYMNADSLKLPHNQEVILASEEISGTKVQFVNSGSKVSEIKISVTPYSLDNETRYLKEGNSFLDPVFKSLRFTLIGINPSLTDSNRDNIEIGATREDRVGLTFTNRLDKEYELNVLIPGTIMLDTNYAPMYNSTCTTLGYHWVNYTSTQNVWNDTTNMTDAITVITPINESYCSIVGTPTYNSTTLGTEPGKEIIVETNKEIQEGDYFVTTSGEYSQIWEVSNIQNDGKIEIQDAMGGNTVNLNIGSVGSTASLSLADGSSATIKLQSTTSLVLTDKAANYLYTYKGAKIVLPKDNSGVIQVIEETPYNGGDFHSTTGNLLGSTLNSSWAYRIGRTGRDMFLKGTNYGIKEINYWSGDVGDNDIYSVTKYGSFIKQTGEDDKKLYISYPENAVKANFYIGEQNSVTQTSTTTTNLTDIIIVKDIEEAKYQNKNIIVVGGSCINAVAAVLLGEDKPVCGEEFTTKTGVTAGHYLVQAFENPWAPDKVAILVAGYNAEDTTKAVNEILVGPMNLTVGNKIIG